MIIINTGCKMYTEVKRFNDSMGNNSVSCVLSEAGGSDLCALKEVRCYSCPVHRRNNTTSKFVIEYYVSFPIPYCLSPVSFFIRLFKWSCDYTVQVYGE
jgi:hypothetical protein